jgi:putative sigma-54 modulation protein
LAPPKIIERGKERMIARIEKSGINVELGDDVKKYIDKKVGHLDRYLTRHARKSVHAEVKLREDPANQAGDKYTCEALLHLPGTIITAKESTLNMFAAVDIVEAKLKNQLRKYKEAHIKHIRLRQHGLLNRLRSKLFTRGSAPQTSEE